MCLTACLPVCLPACLPVVACLRFLPLVLPQLNPVKTEFIGKKVILVDDSIVRGTTSSQIVQMARDVGAVSCKALSFCCAFTVLLSKTVPFRAVCPARQVEVCFCSASPAIIYPNVYGIDMPNVSELVAHGKDEAAVAEAIGADLVVYNDLSDLEDAVREVSPELCTKPSNRMFDTSCFSGKYVTGDIDATYFEKIAAEVSSKALPFCCASAAFLSKTVPFLDVCLSVCLSQRSNKALTEKNRKHWGTAPGGVAGVDLDMDVNDGALMNTPSSPR
eukprot:SAG22_NODE_191_length_15699_cov_19.660192_9_plen_275_part_00